MSGYSINHEVDVHDVDFNGIARVSSIMRYIQSAAQCQLTENGMSYDNLVKANRAFFISKIKIDLPGYVKSYDRVEAVTYPCDSKGYSFWRCYELLNNGITVARAVSVWALMDIERRMPVRVNDFDLGLKTLAPLELELSRIKLPSEITEVGTYNVNYDDADQNRHMNNTKYPDLYSTYLPLDGKRIRSISINYLREAPLGARLKVYRANDADTYLFRTVLEDGTPNSEAEISICNL